MCAKGGMAETSQSGEKRLEHVSKCLHRGKQELASGMAEPTEQPALPQGGTKAAVSRHSVDNAHSSARQVHTPHGGQFQGRCTVYKEELFTVLTGHRLQA